MVFAPFLYKFPLVDGECSTAKAVPVKINYFVVLCGDFSDEQRGSVAHNLL
jgi:hypothetical protein